jgi:hypothetical protein
VPTADSLFVLLDSPSGPGRLLRYDAGSDQPQEWRLSGDEPVATLAVVDQDTVITCDTTSTCRRDELMP